MRKANNKKGIGELRAIIYVFYTSIIILMGIFLIRGLLGNVCIIAEDRASNLDFNALSARVIYSADCFASEMQYANKDGSAKTVIQPGILDKQKLSDSNLLNCIKYNGGDYELSVRDLNGNYLYKDKNACSGDVGPEGDWDRREDLLVQIRDESGEIIDGVMRFCIDVDTQTVETESC